MVMGATAVGVKAVVEEGVVVLATAVAEAVLVASAKVVKEVEDLAATDSAVEAEGLGEMVTVEVAMARGVEEKGALVEVAALATAVAAEVSEVAAKAAKAAKAAEVLEALATGVSVEEGAAGSRDNRTTMHPLTLLRSPCAREQSWSQCR